VGRRRDPDPATDILRAEAQKLGAALLKRGEGIWFAAGSVYICSTSGGPVGGGQIFRYDPPAMGSGGGRLLLLAMSTDRNKLDMPDNITVAPWGDLLMGEDGLGDQFLRGLTPSGEIYELARNAQSTSEFAGVCCSPDGRAVFANLQKDGITLVITGPFPGTNPPRPDGGVPVRDMAAGAPDLQDDEIVPEPASGCSTTGGGPGHRVPAASTGTVGAAALALGAAAVVRRATSGTSD
jgi:hypothetical protein